MSIFDFMDEVGNPFDLDTAQGRRDFIQTTIFELLDMDFKIGESLEFYRELGAGIKSSDFSHIYNDSKRYSESKRISALPELAPIYESHLGAATTSITGQYRFKASITLLDAETKELITVKWVVDTNELLSLADIKETIIDDIVQSQTHYGSIVTNVTVNNGWMA